MKVALFTESFPPSVNGVVTRLRHTISELTAAGDEVLVVAPEGGPAFFHGAEVQPVPAFPLPAYPEVRIAIPRPEVQARVQRFGPDLVHAVNPAVLGFGALWSARGLGVPLVASFHTNLPAYLRSYRLSALEPLAWELLRSIHNQAALNLCVSEPAAADLRARGFERVLAGWRGGVDQRQFNPALADRETRRRLSSGEPDAPLLLYVGRLAAEKSIELLLPVLTDLPGARLAIVGDGPHRSRLEAHFSSAPAEFTGYLHGPELAAAYASADVFVFPSQTDTLGLVLAEAMASGCPVVACRAGGVPALISDGVSGLLFEPEDAAAAASLVRSLLEDAELRTRIRSGGLEAAKAWTWETATNELRGHYLATIRALEPAFAA